MMLALILMTALLLALMVVLLVLGRALGRAGASRRLLLPLAAVVLVWVVAVYGLVGGYRGEQQYLAARAALPTLLAQAQQGDELQPAQYEQLLIGLRARLDEQDDAEGWRLLGRLAWDGEQGDMAFGALQRAWQLAPNDAQTQRDYGRILVMTRDAALQQEGVALLGQLAQQPQELEALSILAFHHLDRGEREQAIGYWQQLRDRLPEGDERRLMIDRTLEQLAAPPAGVTQISVALAPQLLARIPANARLLVFAKAVGGSPMPLAVRQLAVDQWPVSLQLSDADAMMAELKLSQFDTIEITARLTSSATVSAVAGDLEGVSGPISGDGRSQMVTVTIDRQL
ncbi:MAG: hypothetical protein II007_06945 [Gammaproteobacteria bacterium]|nr:hypothetical protein [Gammaproteobacteria bacterium]